MILMINYCLQYVNNNFYLQVGIEPMQVDADPQEHDIVEHREGDLNFIVDNPTLVGIIYNNYPTELFF